MISNTDLYKRKYDIQTLEDNIDSLTIKSLILNQKLTPMFCVKYIIETDDYLCGDKEEFIDMYYVLRNQSHISFDDIIDATIEYYKDYIDTPEPEIITRNSDLYKRKYDIKILEHSYRMLIDKLSLKIIVKTQKLTSEFCIKYILCDQKDPYDVIDKTYILKYQPHLTLESLA